ncbi:unnamed protein product [Musa textilis]
MHYLSHFTWCRPLSPICKRGQVNAGKDLSLLPDPHMQATIVENASPSAVSSNSARVEDADLSFSELHATKADHNRTWSSLFVVANHSENYSLYQEELVFSNEGVLQIKASEEKISEGEEYWKNSLVGYFIGSRPPFQAIRSQEPKIHLIFGGL